MPQPTRIADDLFADAKIEGAREGRSAAEQINHWARVGRTVSTAGTVARRRVEAALAGVLPVDELTAAEGEVFDAEVAAAVDERISATDLGAALAAQGITTVALDEQGRLVEYAPDGTRTIVGEP